MGHVWVAEDTRLKRLCALKFLSPHLRQNAEAVKRLVREAEAAASLSHPNIVEVTDVDGDGNFLVMELLDGENLQDTLAGGPLPWPRARHIMLQVCAALAAAHAKNVIHRDLKPANCVRVRRGTDADFIKIVDFGIAKVARSEPDPLTQFFIGTVEYASPEQVCEQRIDHRTDVWSAGAMFYHLVTGALPFSQPARALLPAAIQRDDVVPPSERAPGADLPPGIDAVLLRALEKSPEARYASMEEFAAAIEALPADYVGPRLEHGTIAFANTEFAPPRLPVEPSPPAAQSEPGRTLEQTSAGSSASQTDASLPARPSENEAPPKKRGQLMTAALPWVLTACALAFAFAASNRGAAPPVQPGAADSPQPMPELLTSPQPTPAQTTPAQPVPAGPPEAGPLVPAGGGAPPTGPQDPPPKKTTTKKSEPKPVDANTLTAKIKGELDRRATQTADCFKDVPGLDVSIKVGLTVKTNGSVVSKVEERHVRKFGTCLEGHLSKPVKLRPAEDLQHEVLVRSPGN